MTATCSVTPASIAAASGGMLTTRTELARRRAKKAKPIRTHADLTFAVKRGDLVKYTSARASRPGHLNRTTLDLTTGTVFCDCKRAETLPPNAPLDCWHVRYVAFAELVRVYVRWFRTLTNAELRDMEDSLRLIFEYADYPHETIDDDVLARWCAVGDLTAERVAKRAAHAENIEAIFGGGAD